jgi:prepilin-type N-terminal cleavage/methylation domain-containing protein
MNTGLVRREQGVVRKHRNSAFTLAEVVISLAIIALIFGGVLIAYSHSARRAQWSGYSLAAQSLSIQQIEQARSAPWDPPITNAITNLLLLSKSVSYSGGNYTIRGFTRANLDLPTSGTNAIVATNFVTITSMSLGSADVRAQMIRVDTVWPFTWGNRNRLFTNTTATILAPDNSDSLVK